MSVCCFVLLTKRCFFRPPDNKRNVNSTGYGGRGGGYLSTFGNVYFT